MAGHVRRDGGPLPAAGSAARVFGVSIQLTLGSPAGIVPVRSEFAIRSTDHES